jgi:hypothetical protein
MPLAHETVVYDVHDFKVYALTDDSGASPVYSAAVDVPGIAEASMDPNFLTAELKGDARIIAKKGRVDKFTCSATYGKVSLDVLNTVLGGTITDTASSSARWRLLGDNSLPYFKAEFKIQDVDTGLGDLHVRLYKCQLTGGTLISGQTDEFGQPTMELEAIPTDTSDLLVDVELLDVVTALSS